jgi:hypothetical protein
MLVYIHEYGAATTHQPSHPCNAPSWPLRSRLRVEVLASSRMHGMQVVSTVGYCTSSLLQGPRKSGKTETRITHIDVEL